MKNILLIVLVAVFVVVLSDETMAQCAMCKLNAENAAEIESRVCISIIRIL